MADQFSRDNLTLTTYHPAAVFQPVLRHSWIVYLFMVSHAVIFLLLIISRYAADEEPEPCGRKRKEFAGKLGDHGAILEVEDRGCQSPRVFVRYGNGGLDAEMGADGAWGVRG